MLVSIITLTYNRANFLKQAIESAFSQTFKDFEILVGDDGSTDETPKIIKEFSNDSRLKYITGEHVYLIKNRQRTISRAQGKYIAILDDDDIWSDINKLQKQVDFLEKNPNYAVAGTGAIIIDLKGNELYRFLNEEGDEKIRERIFFRNPFFASSTLFRRNIFEKVGGYDENLKGAEDWDLWLRMGKYGKFYNLPFYSIKYRLPPLNPHRFINMRQVLKFTKKYRYDYPHYYRARLINWLKMCYTSFPKPSFLENWLLRWRYTKNIKA